MLRCSACHYFLTSEGIQYLAAATLVRFVGGFVKSSNCVISHGAENALMKKNETAVAGIC